MHILTTTSRPRFLPSLSLSKLPGPLQVSNNFQVPLKTEILTPPRITSTYPTVNLIPTSRSMLSPTIIMFRPIKYLSAPFFSPTTNPPAQQFPFKPLGEIFPSKFRPIQQYFLLVLQNVFHWHHLFLPPS